VRSAEWFKEHLNRASARQTEFPGIFISERQLDEARHLRGQHRLRLLDDVGIHATTDGYCAEDFSSLSDPHFCPLLARGCSYGIDQGGEADTPMEGAKLFELLEEFMHEIYTDSVASRNSVS
jgi:hypothetical protein